MAPWSHREPERLPELAAAARDAARDIDQSTADDLDVLAEAFMGAAWPTLQAQNQ
jgi:hypothetical protein